MPEIAVARRLHRVRELAAAVDVGERTVYHWIARGEVKAFRVGRGWRIPAAEFRRVTGDSQAA